MGNDIRKNPHKLFFICTMHGSFQTHKFLTFLITVIIVIGVLLKFLKSTVWSLHKLNPIKNNLWGFFRISFSISFFYGRTVFSNFPGWFSRTKTNSRTFKDFPGHPANILKLLHFYILHSPKLYPAACYFSILLFLRLNSLRKQIFAEEILTE